MTSISLLIDVYMSLIERPNNLCEWSGVFVHLSN